MNRNPAANMPGASKYSAKNFFTYLVSTDTLASAGSTTATFNIDGDSDFFWTKLAGWATIADDGSTVSTIPDPGVTLLITNTTSGRNYSNAPVPMNSVAGNAGLPFILPIETFFPAKATISIQFQNVTDNTDYSNIYLAFHGVKAFF